eukprot:m.128104 g.128104  ORF g.128104 m.128104 type:complete len:339 (-) comp15820_c0_seq2:2445-3461(-)
MAVAHNEVPIKASKVIVLPDDVLVTHIFARLTSGELLNVQQVCKQWQRCANHPRLWVFVNFGISAETRRLSISLFGLKALTHHHQSSIRQLDLEKCDGVSDELIATIVMNCHSIERLNLADCRSITNNSLHTISRRCQSLLVLALRGCRLIDDEGLGHIALGCSKLEYLDIGFLTQVNGESFSLLGKLCHLRHLYMRNTRVSTRALLNLLAFNPPLSYLNCRNCRGLGSASLAALLASKSLRSLQRLDLRAAHVTVGWCQQLIQRAPQLQRLDVDCFASLEGFALQGYDNGWSYVLQACLDGDRDGLETNTFLAGFARGPSIACWQWEQDYGHILGHS